MLGNREAGCRLCGLDFNRHGLEHMLRAAQEGIVFSFMYGMEIMKGMGMDITKIHAGKANMFLSPIFRSTLSDISGATIELFDTDGSVGAAKGAGMGAGIYSDNNDAFSTLALLERIEPARSTALEDAYARWKDEVSKIL